MRGNGATKSLKVAGFLAFTSIRRGNPGIILLTVLILAIVTINLLFVSGLLNGLVDSANNKIRDTFAGDLVVESATENPLISDIGTVIDEIERIDGVVAVTSRNSLGAEAIFENERTNCIVYGVSPEREEDVFKISEYIIEGTYLEPDDRDQILLGIQIAGADDSSISLYARSLKKVHAGDSIQVVYANGIQKTYNVKGIFYSEFIQTDIQAYVSEAEFEIIEPLVTGRASSIRIKISDEADDAAIIEQVRQIRDGLRILTWEDYAGIVRSLTDSFNVIHAILNVVNLLVAGITVFIVTYIDVTNRRRQIGIQRAIGITPGSIIVAYLLRAIFYAIVAAVVAILVFLYVVMPIEARYPFQFPFGDVNLVTGFSSVSLAVIILLCATVVAAFIPVWMTLRIKILDAIWS
ncbi:ABC transporter permease [Chloroflexota bacterium]